MIISMQHKKFAEYRILTHSNYYGGNWEAKAISFAL